MRQVNQRSPRSPRKHAGGGRQRLHRRNRLRADPQASDFLFREGTLCRPGWTRLPDNAKGEQRTLAACSAARAFVRSTPSLLSTHPRACSTSPAPAQSSLP